MENKESRLLVQGGYGLQGVAGEGAGQSAAKIRGAGASGSAGEGPAPIPFLRQTPLASTLASTTCRSFKGQHD